MFNFVPQIAFSVKKKIIILDIAHPEKTDKGKICVWWKTGKYFIRQENIRSLRRKGRKTKISLFHGEDVTVDVDYDKLSVLLPSEKNKI